MLASAAARAFYRDRRVLVVGADGFLGSNAVRALAALSADITMLVRQPTDAPHHALGRLLVGDLKELEVAREAAAGQEIVLNLVGVTSAVDSNRDPCLSLREECFPHLNLLAACADMPSPPLVVFPSSRLVYGTPHYLPVDEAHPTRPTNIYGAHKITVEHYLSIYQRTKGVPYLVLRISNPYGPYRAGKSKSYGIVNHFIQLAMRGEPIRLFGDGGQLRDLVYIDDLIDIMLLAIATPACHNEIFNVGGPQGVSLRRAAEAIALAAGGTPVVFEPWPADYRSVETGDYVSCLDKLKRFVDLPPQASFEEGLAHTLAACREPAGI